MDINNSMGEQFKALYGRKLFSEGAENSAGRFRLTPCFWTAFRLVLWLVLIFELVLIHFFGVLVIMQQEVFIAGSKLEIEYQRRQNLLPRLQAITKAYSRHERGLMHYVSDARALGQSAEKIKKMLGPKKSAHAGKVFARLIALAEQYPNLKADRSYKALMEKTVTAENRVAAAREEYNGRIYKYNRKLRAFPCVIFARLLKFRPMDVYAPQKDPMPVKNARIYFVY